MIDGKNFFDQPVKNVSKVATSKGDNYKTGFC